MAVAATVGVTPAFAGGTSVQLNHLHLVARGVAVNASVTVTCDPYTDVFGQAQTSTPVSVTISEAVRRGHITQGTGTGVATCDSTPHTITVLVQTATYAFIRRSALVSITPTFNSDSTPAALVTTAVIS
jgi:hypothetical protein